MIVDARGNRLNGFTNPKPELGDIAGRKPRRVVNATYDAARDSTQMVNYWANADNYDSDSANSSGVRRRLVARARYEAANNGYVDGILQTHTAFICGTGPQLRMQTTRPGFNQVVEARWRAWCKAVKFRRKLACMVHAKIQDGETFALIVRNKRNGDRVDLDFVPFETEMCHSPGVVSWKQGHIDGIHFDEYGSPVAYDILKRHPGANNSWGVTQESMRVPAKWVLHWFHYRRPGQHRGVPQITSTLNTGAAARRFREATISAAETAANFTAFLHTDMLPDATEENDSPAGMSALEIQRNMMVSLPKAYHVSQMKAEHPTTTYVDFNESLVTEAARPLNMPRNVAMCNSSGYNFASGKLDHGTYFLTVNIDREDVQDELLDPIFRTWYEWARLVYGWGLEKDVPNHTFDWPQHPVGDIKALAVARDTNLKNGVASPSSICAEDGIDWEDHVAEMATDYGVSIEEMKSIVLAANLRPNGSVGTSGTPDTEDVSEEFPDEE